MFFSKSKNLWIERVQGEDGKTHEVSAKTKSELAKKLYAHQVKVDNGPLFSEIADAWEEFHYKKIEPTTAAAYAPHVARAKEFFEGEYIKDITPDRLQAFIEEQAERGYSKDTVRRSKTVLSKLFKYAMVQPGSKVKYNPCAAVDVPRGLSKTRREPPEENQLAKIKPDCEMGLFAYFIFYTGLRDGELLGLRWEDIDRENKIIHVRRVATYPTNKPVIKERAKTAAGLRDIPLLDNLLAVLPDQRNGFVFGGEKPWEKQHFYRAWLKWCIEIGEAEAEEIKHTADNGRTYTRVKYKPKMTPYQFRHQYANILEEAGVSEYDAKEVMGHSSIVVTKDIYTHIRSRKHQTDLAEKLNTHVTAHNK